MYSFRKGYDDKYKQCIALLRKSAGRDVPSSSKSGTTVSCEPPKKKRHIANRVKKVTSEVLAETLNLPGPFQSDNVSAPSKLFDDFTTQLIEDGTIVWQSHSPEKDVIVMNDYNPDTGAFQPMSFCHVTLHHEEQGSIFVHCSCSVYKLLLNGIAGPSDNETEPTHLDMSGITCMHSRFIQEHLLPNWNEALNPDYVAVSRKERKIKESLSARNESIVKLSEAPHLVKFSVRGSNQSFEFVHVNEDQWTISCQSGLCSVHKNKKIRNLEKGGQLCPHLQVMKDNSQLWIPTLNKQIDAENANSEAGPVVEETERKTYFDPTTGFWDFGSLSKHMPAEQNSQKYIENANLHDKWCFENQRDESGLVNHILLYSNLPDHCECGVTVSL